MKNKINNGKTSRGKLFACVVTVASSVSCAAFDADTIAFYPFSGKTAGDSALYDTTENAVDATKYLGTVYQADASTCRTELDVNYGKACWSSDRPGKYVFSRRGYKPDLIATDPASLQVLDHNNYQLGAMCLFDSLASDLGNLGGWTVEWFWKEPSDYERESKQGWFNLPLWTRDGTGKAVPGLKVSQEPNGDLCCFRLYASNMSSSTGAAYVDTRETSLRDGLWHHMAVTYTNNTATLTVDYELSRSATMAVASTNEAVELRLPFHGQFRGLVSCVRVTKRVLKSKEFMAATDNPDCYPRTAFHWGVDGTVGTEAEGTVANRAVAEYANFNTNLYDVVATGQGEYGVDTNGNKAVFSDSIPDKRHRRVVCEEEKSLGEDGSSLYLKTTPLNLTAQSSAVLWTSGTKIVASNSCPSVTGSFTMEMFARINYEAFMTNVQYSTRKRVTLMGLKDAMHSDWNYLWNLELTPPASLNGAWDTIKINAYNDSGANKVAQSYIEFSYKGGWHHIAVTYDDTTGTMQIYFDYNSIKTLSLGGKLPTGSLSGHIYHIGGGLNNHSFDGWIDEVRLVRECLTPDKFLRLKPYPGMKIVFR